MLSVILGWIDALADGHLTWLAWDVHAAALSAVVFFASLPIIKKAYAGLSVKREVTWVRFWVCPDCGQLNRRSFLTCQRCEKARKISRWKSWFESLGQEKIMPVAGLLAAMLRVAGWIIFYGALGLTIAGFRLYSFHQHPTQEFLGSLALIFLLLALLYSRRALQPVPKSPLNFLTDLIAAAIMTAFFFAAGLLWAAVPYRMHRPLASIQAVSANELRARVVGRSAVVARGETHGHDITWTVQYAVFSWPLFDIRQILLMRFSDQAVEDPWLMGLLEWLAPRLQAAGGSRPRLILLTQELAGIPGRSYDLAEDPFGNGLTLTPSSQGAGAQKPRGGAPGHIQNHI